MARKQCVGVGVVRRSRHHSHHHLLVKSFSMGIAQARNQRRGSLKRKPHRGEDSDCAPILLDDAEMASGGPDCFQALTPDLHKLATQSSTTCFWQEIHVKVRRPTRVVQLAAAGLVSAPSVTDLILHRAPHESSNAGPTEEAVTHGIPHHHGTSESFSIHATSQVTNNVPVC